MELVNEQERDTCPMLRSSGFGVMAKSMKFPWMVHIHEKWQYRNTCWRNRRSLIRPTEEVFWARQGKKKLPTKRQILDSNKNANREEFFSSSSPQTLLAPIRRCSSSAHHHQAASQRRSPTVSRYTSYF
ncbi:hypothetical protein ACHQM5_007889 [Ranunculus cassubicifolius]